MQIGNRYFHGMTADADEQNFSLEASEGTRSLGMGSNTDSMWCLMPPQLPSSPMVKPKNDSQLLDSSRQIRMPNPFEPMNDTTISGQHQHCFFSSDIGSPGTVKQEQRSMRPFFDEWPTTKESWSNLDDEGSNKNNFSTTQLSISIPMAPPDFSSRSSCSPNGELTSSSNLFIQLKSHSIARQPWLMILHRMQMLEECYYHRNKQFPVLRWGTDMLVKFSSVRIKRMNLGLGCWRTSWYLCTSLWCLDGLQEIAANFRRWTKINVVCLSSLSGFQFKDCKSCNLVSNKLMLL